MDRKLSAAVLTEAAAWVARLHGPLRTPAVEKGLRSWLTESSDHPRALERVTESWEEVASLKRVAKFDIRLRSDISARPGRRKLLSLALAAMLGLLVLGGVLYDRVFKGVETGVGEQRLLALSDGSRVTLNTATQVRVDYSRKSRHLYLDAGEALFEVASHRDWPFVVSAGGREITALGTSFLVRRDAERTAVTLVDGKVAVAAPAEARPEILAPGERLTFLDDAQAVRLDRPVVSKLTAWQRGKIPIDNLPLSQAIIEMNRYSARRLAVGSPEVGELRVSGIFRAGDALSFARAVAQNYGLKVEEERQRIVLSADSGGR